MVQDSTAPIRQVEVHAYRIPTQVPESDGTLQWNSTTLVVVHVSAGPCIGMGYGYSDATAAALIAARLAPAMQDNDALAVDTCWRAMADCVRNLGRSGLCAQAMAAVDIALWDLKARLLGVSVARLLGIVRAAVPAYGSGGFTSMTLPALREQAREWTQAGLTRVKIKIGRHNTEDVARVQAVRSTVPAQTEVFVDANGGYTPALAIRMAHRFAALDVSWFEEPVSSDDLHGLRQVREHAPPGMQISAGEYGFVPDDFLHLLQARCIDVLQADATRCGVTGWLGAAALCDAFHVPMSSHCAPALHASLCAATSAAVHAEHFEDHARIEARFFDGSARLRDGCLIPDPGAPGFGLTFKEQDARCYLT
ncbi:enolase C-terminal domain-like protein [Ralstonia sp. L16]|uniref:enolase C-terminal domain-like protein n=1 Tax=unclassified Ralstonia TaxID=209769 RepID=UPI003F7AA4BC